MKDLTPPDLAQCQVNQYNPFVLGGSVHSRCTNKPAFVVHETVPAEDGLMGSMSVCHKCRNTWETKNNTPGVNATWRWERIK